MSFVGWFFLLVLGVGAVELYLLIHVAGALGFWATLGLCLLTGVVGGAFVRQQGLATLIEIQRGIAYGRMPAVEITSGVMLIIIGALLIVPGFLTDTLGFVLLIPPLRYAAAASLVKLLHRRNRLYAERDFR